LQRPARFTDDQATYHNALQQQYLQEAQASYYHGALQQQPFVPRAPAIIRPHDEREAAWRAEIAEQHARLAAERTAEGTQRRLAANARARELLLEHLTPQQRETFTKHHWFIVEGGRSKQKYRINGHRGLSGNVDVVGASNRVSHRLCAHLNSTLPMGDQLVAQKLMLEFDEDEFLRIANRHAA
jgi:hypothetical protein